MNQRIDVLAIFDIRSNYPRPIRFKVHTHGDINTFYIDKITNRDCISSNGIPRLVYSCSATDKNLWYDCRIHYFFKDGRWEIEF